MRRTAAAQILFAISVLALASCGDRVSSGMGATGIEGQVLIGPACPVVQEGTPCPDRPYAGEVRVLQGDAVVTTFETSEDGRFRVPLEPGSYVLEGVSPPDGGPPFAKPVDVTVPADGYVRVDVLFDSGIR